MARSRRTSRETLQRQRQRQRERSARDRAREAAAKETLSASKAASQRSAREHLFTAARARTQAIKAGRHGLPEAAALLRETAAEQVRLQREAERGAAADRRWLKSLVTPAKRRTTYQRRVASGAVRQVERERATRAAVQSQLPPEWPPANWQRDKFRDRFSYAWWLGYSRQDASLPAKFLMEPFEVQLDAMDDARLAHIQWLQNKREDLGLEDTEYRSYHTNG